jgi:hypothetical protein
MITHSLVPSTNHSTLSNEHIQQPESVIPASPLQQPLIRTHHTQTSSFVLVHNVRQNLTRSSDRDPLFVPQLMHSTLHSQIRLPTKSNALRISKPDTEYTEESRRGETNQY